MDPAKLMRSARLRSGESMPWANPGFQAKAHIC